ncbi:MAG TPA: DEAD/DEAH box helicase [Burkholderiales bacterium]|nr:DEAD/DEAH box helicase [Burkholderiales bacterium]
MTFEQLGLHTSILQALTDAGYNTPTPIQAQAIPQALAGHDIVASAQTGTGKTAAFVLPTLQRLTTPSTGQGRGPRVLVLTPTRELANQVTDAAVKYGRHLRFRIGSIVGGVSYGPQMKLLAQPLDILVATPGRLMDHMESRRVDFSRLEVLVLDEADRMLDMGFIHAVQKIAAALPAARQTLLFSATLEGDVAKLTNRMLKNPQRIQIASVQERHENIEQRLHHVDGGEHKHSLLSHLLDDIKVEKAIVFTATKRGADKLAKRLHAQGHPAAALHGNMNQNQRNRAMQSLRTGRVRLLVATDVAARGLDVNGITHVFNFDLPKVAEDYVHRIGRTGRAGAKGIAISFATPQDRGQLRDIERYTRRSIPAHVVEGMEPKAVPVEQRRHETKPQQPRRHKPSQHMRPNGSGRNKPRHSEARPSNGNRHGAGNTQQRQEPRQTARGDQPRTEQRHAANTRRDGNRPLQRRSENKSVRRENQRPVFG